MSEIQGEVRDRQGTLSLRRLALLGCAIVIVFMLLRSMWLSDDAYISFRSSQNLAHGLGLRWNLDERVQAFTNPLWTLLAVETP